MPFPISMRGKIIGTCRDIEKAKKNILSRLELQSPKELLCEGNTVKFRGGLLRPVLSTNLLGPIKCGTLKFDTDKTGMTTVNYQLNTSEITIFTTVATLIFFIIIFMRPNPDYQPLLIIWLWIVGGNYAITFFRFRTFLREALNYDEQKF